MANRKSQKDRLVTAFNSGYDFTTDQIASRLNVSDSRARFLITELRQDGYAIYKNSKTINGVTTPVYRLGTPSRAMVAAAFELQGSSLFA
jgi:predicted ArsR family transcriptional regulator